MLQIVFPFCYSNPQKSTMVEYYWDSLIRFRFFHVGLMPLIPSQSQWPCRKAAEHRCGVLPKYQPSTELSILVQVLELML